MTESILPRLFIRLRRKSGRVPEAVRLRGERMKQGKMHYLKLSDIVCVEFYGVVSGCALGDILSMKKFRG